MVHRVLDENGPELAEEGVARGAFHADTGGDAGEQQILDFSRSAGTLRDWFRRSRCSAICGQCKSPGCGVSASTVCQSQLSSLKSLPRKARRADRAAGVRIGVLRSPTPAGRKVRSGLRRDGRRRSLRGPRIRTTSCWRRTSTWTFRRRRWRCIGRERMTARSSAAPDACRARRWRMRRTPCRRDSKLCRAPPACARVPGAVLRVDDHSTSGRSDARLLVATGSGTRGVDGQRP